MRVSPCVAQNLFPATPSSIPLLFPLWCATLSGTIHTHVWTPLLKQSCCLVSQRRGQQGSPSRCPTLKCPQVTTVTWSVSSTNARESGHHVRIASATGLPADSDTSAVYSHCAKRWRNSFPGEIYMVSILHSNIPKTNQGTIPPKFTRGARELLGLLTEQQ